MASRATAKSFFPVFFFFCKKMMYLLTKKNFKFKIKKKSSHSAVICSPGRWSGNNIFLKDGLTCREHMVARRAEAFGMCYRGIQVGPKEKG